MHDAAGNRLPCKERDTYLGRKLVVGSLPQSGTTSSGDGPDQPTVFAGSLTVQADQAVTERYAFDAQNRLKAVTRDDIWRASSFADNYQNFRQADHITVAGYGSTLFKLEQRRYDALGQLLEVQAEEAIANDTIRLIYGLADPNQPKGNAMPGIGDERLRYQYDKLGRMQRQSTWGSDWKFSSTVSYQNEGGTGVRRGGDQSDKVSSALPDKTPNGYDLAGNVLQYTVFNASGPASTFRMDYVWRDGALLTTTTGYRDKAPRPGVTLKTYDGNGHIRSVIDPSDTKSDITRQFNTDANGTVLRSVQVGQEVPSYLQVDADGKPLPPVRSNAGDLTANEQFQLVAAGQVLGRYGEIVNPDAARNKDNNLQFIADQDFNFVFKSVNDGAAQGTSTYTVVKGDTLQSIAKAQLGDADLWFTIAQANGLADSAGLEEGQVLRIPAVVVTSTNNDDGTFEAYDPTAVIGDTTPVIPQPPKKKKNWLKQLVIVVVIVVVAAVTQQWWLTTYGTPTATTAAGVTLTGSAATSAVAAGTATATGFTAGSMLVGGAIGGAVGSVAGQLTGMALGEQDSFSWKQVGLGALGGGISGGLSTVSALSNSALGGAFQGAATRAAISSAVTQGIGVATGLQESFSWRSVGLSALSAGISEGLGEHWGGGANWQNNSSLSNTTKFAIDAGSRLVGNTVAQAVTNKGGKVEWGRVLADSFGTAIANAIPRGLVSGGSQQADKAAQMNQTQGSGLSLNAPGGSGLKLTPSAVQAFLNRPDMQLGGGATQSVGSTYYPQPGSPDFMGPMPSGSVYLPAGSMSREVYHDGKLIQSAHWPDPIPTLANPEAGVQTFAIRSAQIESRDLPRRTGPIQMQSQDVLETLKQQDLTSYQAMQDNARNPLTYIGAKFGGLATEVFYDLAGQARGLYRFATDADTRTQVVNQLGYLAANPMVVVNGINTGINNFIEKPFNEQAESVFKFGLSGFAGAGAAKVGSFAGGLTLQGAKTTVSWMTPELGLLSENLLHRSGGLSYVIAPTNRVMGWADAIPEVSPYVTRYDPLSPGRPNPAYSIDTSLFSSGTATSGAGGGLRNSSAYWKAWVEQVPQSLSPTNLALARRGAAPTIDSIWISVFPEHSAYLGNDLIHHHVNFGRYAIPVPRATHTSSSGIWHLQGLKP